jgi:hypothetical protein
VTFVLLSSPAWAQFNSTLQGIVQDASKAAITGMTVKLNNKRFQTKAVRASLTTRQNLEVKFDLEVKGAQETVQVTPNVPKRPKPIATASSAFLTDDLCKRGYE